MISFKATVRVQFVDPVAFEAIGRCHAVYASHGVNPMVVTSIYRAPVPGGSPSLHPAGKAFDLRSKNIRPFSRREDVWYSLQRALGDDYDVLWEFRGEPEEHFHVEYDPC